MKKAVSPAYRLIKKVKDQNFDIDNLHHYTLSLQVGIHDFQLCVTDGRESRILLLEDFRLDGIRTVNTRVKVLNQLFDDHHFLKAGFWNSVKLCVKSHKFTLVPSGHFAKDAASDYLLINSEIRPEMEDVLFYKHNMSEAVNIFAADQKLISWIKSLYPSVEVGVVHQGSALIEGIMKYDDHSNQKTMFCSVDLGILHVVVTQNKELLYYNQFAARKSEDYLKYIMSVFKELRLSPKKSKVLIWGSLKQKSEPIELLKKYIMDISYAGKPNYLKFGHAFDEIPDYHYFDAYSVFLCE